MKKIKLSIEVELDDNFTLDDDEKTWLAYSVLSNDGTLSLYSTEIGDTLGVVTKVKNIKFIDEK